MLSLVKNEVHFKIIVKTFLQIDPSSAYLNYLLQPVLCKFNWITLARLD